MENKSTLNLLKLAQEIADRLSRIKGVMAISLGGSLARNEAHSDSDIDLGLYYNPDHPPSIKQLSELAATLDDSHADNLATSMGEWGLWINGGAWLKINKQPVDWLYRDIAFTSKVIEACQAGITNCYYYPGHPHGFHDHYYLADIYYCRVLFDHNDILASFKKKVESYPPLLKKTLIEKYLWEANFSLQASLKALKRVDIFYITGCLFRCIACLVQVIFAVNERYINNEKNAIQAMVSFIICPNNFQEIVSSIMAKPGSNADELATNIKKLENLIAETKNLI